PRADHLRPGCTRPNWVNLRKNSVHIVAMALLSLLVCLNLQSFAPRGYGVRNTNGSPTHPWRQKAASSQRQLTIYDAAVLQNPPQRTNERSTISSRKFTRPNAWVSEPIDACNHCWATRRPSSLSAYWAITRLSR